MSDETPNPILKPARPSLPELSPNDLDELMDRAKWLIDNAIQNGDCLECHMSRDKDGYCQVGIGLKNYRAHRLVYTAFKCDPVNLFVLHTCDNPKCINIKHLFLGTQQDNVTDMISKGRKADITGIHRALTPTMVLDIRASIKLGVKQRELALKYNVDQSTISNVVTMRRGYRDV